MNKPSPLLMVFALLLIFSSAGVFFFMFSTPGKDRLLMENGIKTNAKIEFKKDSVAKNAEGESVSFVYVSFQTDSSFKPKDHIEPGDSISLDSIAALKRMLIAENFNVKIPGLTFAKLPIEKKAFEEMKEEDSLKIVYDSYDHQKVKLDAENKPKPIDKNMSTWITISIIFFMAGIWLLIMNKRRRSQGQESDPLSSMTTYSTIKKDQATKTGGGRPV